MKIVWKHAPISTNEITDKLLQTTSWSPKTIQTLIKRLMNKGVLTYEKQSRGFVYTPVVKESEYIGQESNSFLAVSYTHLDVYKRQEHNRTCLLQGSDNSSGRSLGSSPLQASFPMKIG